MKPLFYIGIDPGDRNGFAVWDVQEREIVRVKTYFFHDLIRELEFYLRAFDRRIVVVLEATYLNKKVFRKSNNPGKAARMARNVGMNQQVAKLIRDWCKAEGIELIESRPGKNSITKLTQQQFETITKSKIKTSNHGRDAAMLVYGRT